MGTWLVLWGIVAAILIGYDRMAEARRNRAGVAPDFVETRPMKYVAVAFCVGGLVLPFYFYAAKRSFRGFLIGLGWLAAALATTTALRAGVVMVIAQRPHVHIGRPADGSTIRFDDARFVSFSANVEDLRDGTIPVRNVVWVMDGKTELGRGAFIPVTSLPAGKHLVTVTATDSAGNKASDAVHVTVVARKP